MIFKPLKLGFELIAFRFSGLQGQDGTLVVFRKYHFCEGPVPVGVDRIAANFRHMILGIEDCGQPGQEPLLQNLEVAEVPLAIRISFPMLKTGVKPFKCAGKVTGHGFRSFDQYQHILQIAEDGHEVLQAHLVLTGLQLESDSCSDQGVMGYVGPEIVFAYRLWRDPCRNADLELAPSVVTSGDPLLIKAQRGASLRSSFGFAHDSIPIAGSYLNLILPEPATR
ncbi:TPA: hypothetical protein L6A15_15330 [Pseudomonas aeruginosa]|nr:hypothetical protein [Pseudomonas aeruginosa]HBP6355305.1 hypothetical protein [Pseudomonas aeruginosa]